MHGLNFPVLSMLHHRACAPGGGFILDFACGNETAKPENLQAFFETCATYGKY
jgi:hypothetical protein